VNGRIDNIEVYPKQYDDGVDWIHLAQDRGLWRSRVNTVMYLRRISHYELLKKTLLH